MKENFPCHYERDEKGIYMEVDTDHYEDLVGITFYVNSNVEGEVCLDKEQTEKLIEMLQESLKK